ncbi:MAG: hypothetical protein H0S79_12630 [Anaerolineaceae bacterium]|nr:hypothetical protein [Anaerolineaceae bacterium]
MEKRTGWNKWLPRMSVIAGVSLVLGAVMQRLLRTGSFWRGTLVGALLIFLVGMAMLLVWRQTGSGKTLARMMVTAFILRLAVGVFLAWGLPQFGYEEPTQQAGFVFFDAFRRDGSAWELAQSGDPLSAAFSDQYSSDQYGGLLWMSALVYRTLSPDAYRPGLILILSAGAIALSVPFLVQFVRPRMGEKVALWTGWILVLYPEGVLLGASQMREPFYILLFCIILWAAGHWLDRTKLGLVLPAALISAFALFSLSYRVAIPVVGAVLMWIWIEESRRIEKAWIKYAGWGALVLAAGVGLYLVREWMIAAFNWDSYLTVHGSGMVQYLLDVLPGWSQIPFIVTYGMLQPVLPAALVAPAPWIWKSVAIFRAVGWYTLLPCLVYGVIRVWKAKPEYRRMLVYLILVSWAWTLTASLRAGGDQWDNPRYRFVFLPWMAVISAWGLHYATQTRDRWFQRILILEGIFVLTFTGWYLTRYFPGIPVIDFLIVSVVIGLVGLAVIFVGWLKDRKKLPPG